MIIRNAYFNAWLDTVKLVANLLEANKIDYAVYGSGACVLHGTTFPESDNPRDIDITVLDLRRAAVVLQKNAGDKYKIAPSSDSSLLVKKFKISLTNKQAIDIDLTDSNDFGLNFSKKEKKNGIIVTSLVETLQSILARITKRGARPKDIFAFRNLISNNAEHLEHSVELRNHSNVTFTEEILACVKFSLNEKKEQEILRSNVDADDKWKYEQRNRFINQMNRNTPSDRRREHLADIENFDSRKLKKI
jgi:hypothetical protein